MSSKILITIAVYLLVGIMYSSCVMPVTNTDDNILVTYEMDTVGSLAAITAATILEKDSLPPIGDSVINAPDIIKQNGEVVEWNKSYPSTEIVAFAKTLMGIPYLYGSTDPSAGFDCSGFITYVFYHFGLKVPRSSVEFTNRGREVPAVQALPGDLILFTGTDSTDRTVGHMGIVIEPGSDGGLQFIHSSSGKANGVTVSPLEGYYEKRFVKVISVREGI